MQWKNPKTKKLIEAVLALKDGKEARMFFHDLLTEKEILEMGNRWKAARMLDKKIPYSEIIKETGLSSTTIARISKWLKNGLGGYELMLKRISRNHHEALSRRGKG